jgi:hypothetical protein
MLPRKRRSLPSSLRAPSKRVAQFLHARARARERYGLSLTWEDVDRIVKCIQQRQSVALVSRTCKRITVWDVLYEGRTVRVVYDRRERNLITFLPEGGGGSEDPPPPSRSLA